MTTTKNTRIYGHKQAGRRAYDLFEEIANLQTIYAGEVFIRRTLRTVRPGETKEYPSVYEVIYQPNFWQRIDRNVATRLFDIGDKYQCRVTFVVKDNHAVAQFHDAGPNFKGN